MRSNLNSLSADAVEPIGGANMVNVESCTYIPEITYVFPNPKQNGGTVKALGMEK